MTLRSGQWSITGSGMCGSGLHISENGGILPFSCFLSDGWNVVMATRAATRAFLYHDGESVVREQQKEPGWGSHATFQPCITYSWRVSWENDFMVFCLNYCYFGDRAGFFTNTEGFQVPAQGLDSGRSSAGPLWTLTSSCINKTVNIKVYMDIEHDSYCYFYPALYAFID